VPFSEWFDAAGHFVTTPFQEMLATKSPIIGAADPKRVASAKAAKAQARKEKYAVDDGKTLDDKWASLLAESSGVTADVSEDSGVEAKTTSTSGGKAKRRGKKA
jgi:signal peptidase complex subunit 2